MIRQVWRSVDDIILMMIGDLFQLRTFGDPVLRSSTTEISDPAMINDLVSIMETVMHESDGIGLAAPQIGVLKRLITIRVPTNGQPEEECPLLVLINPVLEWFSSEQETLLESCLSIPGLAVPVTRSIRCRVRTETMDGQKMIEFTGRPARVVQHELDHLEGKLILDHADDRSRKDYLRRPSIWAGPG